MTEPTIDLTVGIDLHQRKAGETIMLETDSHVYEMVVVNPQRALVRVSSSDPRLHEPVVCQIGKSVSVVDEGDVREAWIGPARQLTLVFRNAEFVTGAAIAAGVRGKGWNYEVF